MKSLKISSQLLYGFILFLVAALMSCSGQQQQKNKDSKEIVTQKQSGKKPPSSYSDTIIIHPPAAVCYNPDSLQLEKIKNITDTSVFESMLHDCFFQQRNSRKVLKEYYPYVKIIDISNIRYLVFEKLNGEKEYIDLDTKQDPCGIFLFDGRKSPQLVDMMNIDTELGFYFSK